MIKKITFLTLFLFSLTIVAQTTVVSSGDTWKYYYNSSAPSNDGEGDTWKENAYDDSAWSSGPSKLGNDHSPTTSVGNNPVVHTTYFRHTFNVADASVYTDISFRAIRDDGIVVYLNGVEVWRDHMPGGTITHTTAANTPAVGGSDETTWFTSGSLTNTLITGSNTIAVEVHQVNSGSSDLSFDLELIGTPFATAEEIPADATWRYLDDGSDQGTAWRASAFDDSSWASGGAELGYGDGDETTTVGYGGDANNKHITTYFRKEFTIADHTAWGSLDLEAIRDDGMVVYLNGVEIWRDNITGAVSYNTLADSPEISGSAESTWLTTNVPSTGLITGTNVIAVEIHQQRVNSSDISFNFKLTPKVVTTPPTPTAEEIPADANWRYLDDGSDQGTAWRASAFDDSSWSYGNAELGYGDGDETTIVGYGPDANNKYPTTYFRKEFTIADHTAWNSIDLEAIRDDGMVVYLNGTEVWRDHISGTVNYNTYADSPAIGGGDESLWITTNIPASGLITGTNVIAVEIHQVNASSSDLSFNFKLTPSIVPVGAPSVVRGPYLQTGTSSSVIIKWRTNNPTESIVNYGTSLGSLSSSESDLSLKTDHEITITGLTPNTKYYYEIANLSSTYLPEDSEMYIKTAPVIGTDQFVRAWILGDAGTANTNQRNVRDQYYSYVSGASSNPGLTDMMLFLGDNAYNSGTDSEYQAAFFDIYEDMLRKSVAWSTLGNHDGYSVDFNTQSGPYYDIFSFPTAAEAGGTASGTEEYYSFDYANIHFIVLQSNNVDGGGNEPAFNTAQKAWLTTDINATTQDWIVAFFHHPPYTKGSHDSDNSGENGLQTMREQYLPILEAGGVDLVLSGHSHSYERSYFINGHTGISNTYSHGTHAVGTNGHLSGKADTADGEYTKAPTDTDGAVYITTGSAGKISGGSLNHNAMYASLNQLGSCVLEIESDGSTGQNMNVKFLTDSGTITDYFTINKSGITLSTDTDTLVDGEIKLFPVPANSLLNIDINQGENLKNIKIYDALGKVVKETQNKQINVSSLNAGLYIVQISTDKNEYFKNIIIK